MTFDNFTIKAQQAVQHAIDKATGNAPLTTSSRAIRAFRAADNHIWTMMPTRCCRNHKPSPKRKAMLTWVWNPC